MLLGTPVSFYTSTLFKALFEHQFIGECIAMGSDTCCLGWGCSTGRCLFEGNGCIKDVIFIEKDKDGVPRCLNYSDISRGHKDWFQNLNPDGTPKGGHIDDDYANKMDKDKKANKSFRDHLRQKI